MIRHVKKYQFAVMFHLRYYAIQFSTRHCVSTPYFKHIQTPQITVIQLIPRRTQQQKKDSISAQTRLTPEQTKPNSSVKISQQGMAHPACMMNQHDKQAEPIQLQRTCGWVAPSSRRSSPLPFLSLQEAFRRVVGTVHSPAC